MSAPLHSVAGLSARRKLIIALLIALMFGFVAMALWALPNHEAAPAKPPHAVVADAYMEAFAAGDTPTACGYATGDARSALNGHRWCEAPQGWNQPVTTLGHCVIPDNLYYPGADAYSYRTQQPINGFTVQWVVVRGDPGKVVALGSSPDAMGGFCG